MNSNQFKRPSIATCIGISLCLLTVVCRWWRGLADVYALYVYPVVSGVLSWLSSWTRGSLQDVALVALVLTAFALPIMAWRKRWGWKRWALKELKLLMWTYVWFYMAWCTNYFRSDLYSRLEVKKEAYNEQAFNAFIADFATAINEECTADTVIDYEALETEIKDFYGHVPERYGLATPRSWQHPKTTLFNPVYSAVGIMGFMEPLFAESCLNRELLPFDRPFVYAHEYAHLLGISSEAECNWWAFQACTASKHQAVRFSGYKGIVMQVRKNIMMLQGKEAHDKWMSTLSPVVRKYMSSTKKYWDERMSPTLRRFHELTYNSFLKSNSITSGLRNYSEVVGMLMTIPKTS